MKIPPYTITPEQFAVYQGIQKVVMAWVALGAALVLFSVVLAFFLYALFALRSEWISKVLLGTTDTTLGFALKQVYSYLFPNTPPP